MPSDFFRTLLDLNNKRPEFNCQGGTMLRERRSHLARKELSDYGNTWKFTLLVSVPPDPAPSGAASHGPRRLLLSRGNQSETPQDNGETAPNPEIVLYSCG